MTQARRRRREQARALCSAALHCAARDLRSTRYSHRPQGPWRAFQLAPRVVALWQPEARHGAVLLLAFSLILVESDLHITVIMLESMRAVHRVRLTGRPRLLCLGVVDAYLVRAEQLRAHIQPPTGH